MPKLKKSTNVTSTDVKSTHVVQIQPREEDAPSAPSKGRAFQYLAVETLADVKRVEELANAVRSEKSPEAIFEAWTEYPTNALLVEDLTQPVSYPDLSELNRTIEQEVLAPIVKPVVKPVVKQVSPLYPNVNQLAQELDEIGVRAAQKYELSPYRVSTNARRRELETVIVESLIPSKLKSLLLSRLHASEQSTDLESVTNTFYLLDNLRTIANQYDHAIGWGKRVFKRAQVSFDRGQIETLIRKLDHLTFALDFDHAFRDARSNPDDFDNF